MEDQRIPPTGTTAGGKRRSSILKPIAPTNVDTAPVGPGNVICHPPPTTLSGPDGEPRRKSKRISFNANIFCQEILPDGNTQVVTELIKHSRTEGDTSSDMSLTMEDASVDEAEKTHIFSPETTAAVMEIINSSSSTLDGDDALASVPIHDPVVDENNCTKIFSSDETNAMMEITRFVNTAALNTTVQGNGTLSNDESWIASGKENTIPDEVSAPPIRQSSPDQTKVFDSTEAGMELTTACIDVSMKSVSEEQDDTNKTNIFTDKSEAAMSVDETINDPSPPSSQANATKLSTKSMDTEKEENSIFLDKSESFQRRQVIAAAFSRLSLPRRSVGQSNLDSALQARKAQLNRTMNALKDASLSSMDSYSDSPVVPGTPKAAKLPGSSKCMSPVGYRRRKSWTLTPSKLVINTSTPQLEISCSYMAREKARVNTSKPGSVIDIFNREPTMTAPIPTQMEDLPEQNISRKHDERKSSASSAVSSNPLLSPSSSQGADKDKSEGPKSLSNVTQIFSMDSDSESDSVLNSACDILDKSYQLPESDDETKEDDKTLNNQSLHEDTMFDLIKSGDTSFLGGFSPDCSFRSDYCARRDTLVIRAEELDEKLANCSILNSTICSITSDSGRDATFAPLRRWDGKQYGGKITNQEGDCASVVFLFGTLQADIELGPTLRSFNGIPIRVIQRIRLESNVSDDPSVPLPLDRNMMRSPIYPVFDERHRIPIQASIHLVINQFAEVKTRLLSQYSTSDQLPDLLTELGNFCNQGRDLLIDLGWACNYYPWQLWNKPDLTTYEFAFELTSSGGLRNFFLLLPIDVQTFPDAPIKVRFGFIPEEKHHYNVNSFAKFLGKVVPSRSSGYIGQLIQKAKEYVYLKRRVERQIRKQVATV